VGGDLTYQQILGRLAPCGIDCQRCVMCADGVVQRTASDLSVALEGFDKMAARMAEHASGLAGYEKFQQILGLLTEVTCTGCRVGGSSLPFCAARTCFREHGVGYCFQCEDYPCAHNDYPEQFAQHWRAANDRMREVGVEQYYGESLLKARYE
jgi:hypothetical protein